MFSFRLLALGAFFATAATWAATAPAEVVVTTPRRGDINRFVTLPATLRPNQQVTLHAKVAGYLKAITVDKGAPSTKPS